MKALFVIFSLTGGFFSGALVAGLTLPKQTGLEGGAVVLVYGVIGVIIGIALSLIFMNKIKPALLKKITIGLIIFNFFFIAWIVFKVISALPETEQQQNPPHQKTQPIVEPAMFLLPQNYEKTEVGLGMAKHDFYDKRVLYFYSPNLEKSVLEHTPSDSIVFVQTEHHQFDISYAPPWFYPEHLKLDYDIFYMKILTLGKGWIEVEVNKQTGLSSWISASDVEIILWPEFLLTVFLLENPYPEKNILHVKPLLNASPYLLKNYSFLQPVMIKDSWVKVNLLDNDFNKTGEAWLRWYADGRLLISYSLLS